MKINSEMLEQINRSEKALEERFSQIDAISFQNQEKVLSAMQENRLSERHFMTSTGYAYSDEGRDVCEQIFADVFGAEAALVRPQIVSGTHAIALALFGVLRSGDELLSVTSLPYDTVQTMIGLNEQASGSGTLKELGVEYSQTDFTPDGDIDLAAVLAALRDKTKAIFLQRSTGYARRRALSLADIKRVIDSVKKARPDIIVIVDNCYGEFLDTIEPTDIGADLICGSLIKNPGGGLVHTGGYVIGRQKYVNLAAARLTAPGIALEVGANLGVLRSYMQGLFIAPSVVAGALKGAVLTAKVLAERGFDVFPAFDDARSDIIQAAVLNSREKLIAYCRGIQAASPVDSFASPEPWDMPGYDAEIIMAAGNFVSGSSIELSADAPMKEPYIVYQQGGLTYNHAKLGLCYAIAEMEKVK